VTTAIIEPFGFLTMDSLRAGWWLSWRIFVRVVLFFAVSAVIGLLLIKGAFGSFVMALGFCAGTVWSILLIPKLTSRWAQERYGYPLDGALRVWWGVAWRGMVASLVAAVILAVPNVVALSLQTAYKGGVLGSIAGLVISLLNIANAVVSVVATGWAMSKVAAEQLSGLAPVAMVVTPAALSPIEVEPPVVVAQEPAPAPRPAPRAAPAPRPAPRAAPAPAAPPVVSAEGKRQCPKCGLYETERGSVIGWYCKVCGWREARR